MNSKIRPELIKNDEDRVKLVTNTNESFLITREHKYGKKSSEESVKFRNYGNALFNSSFPNLEEVLKFYAKSILYAPPASEQLALAYANRSAVLFRGKYYEECLKDISRALETGYPDNLKPKLLIRRVTCNYALTGTMDFEKDEALIEARRLIEKLPATNKMRKMVEDALKNPERITLVGRQQKKTRLKYQPVMKGRNPHLPGASDAIALKYSEEFGRHLVATRDINCGEVLLIQRPYAIIVPDQWIYCICSHCAKATWNGIPCDYCAHAMFCSVDCKYTAWKDYHDVECEVLGIAKIVKDRDFISLGCRLTVKAIKEAGSLEALRKRLKELDSIKESDIDIPIDPNSYETFYIMADHPECYDRNHLLGCSLIAGKLTYDLAVKTNLLGEKETGDLKMIKDSEKFLFVAGLMTKNIRIAQNRMYGLTVKNQEQEKKDYVIMLTAESSFLNTRCYDAAQKLRFDEDIVFITPVPINKGDQVFTHYYMDYTQISRNLRRKFLKHQWHFDCNCLACTEDWTESTAAWNDEYAPPVVIITGLDALEKVPRQFPKEVGDPMELIPLKEHFCRVVDFTYPQVKKPSLMVNELVRFIQLVDLHLSSTVFPRFVTDL